MRTGLATLVLVHLTACTGEMAIVDMTRDGPPGRPADPVDPDAPPPWSLTIDTSGMDPFLPATATTAPVRGRVTASEGLGRLEIAGTPATTTGDGTFSADVPIAAGLNLITIDAFDLGTPEHQRHGHRAVIASDLRLEGDVNPAAAAISVTDGMLAEMIAPLSPEVARIDVASEIMGRGVLSSDDRCTTYPDRASHGTPTIALSRGAAGELLLQITIPNLVVDFHGQCRLLFSSTDITGRMSTSVVIQTALTAPPSTTCVTGLEHAPSVVDLRDFDMDVRGGSGLSGLIVSLAAELREGDSAEEMKRQFAAQADMLIGERLGGLDVFGEPQMLTMFDTPITLDLCLTGLAPEAGELRARVGAAVSGPGTGESRGAPQIAGELPPAMPGALTLDANLVGQLVYSAWRAGALDQSGVEEIDLDLLTLLAPRLRGRYPAGTRATVSIDATLPPIVRAAAVDAGGDLVLELGDLYLEISVGSDLLFRIGTVLKLTLELTPEMGALRPTVSNVEAQAYLLAEPVADVDDASIESVIQMRIAESASALLGDATLSLPSFGGEMRARDVVADPGGRYVHILLE